jgi:spermidine synthase
VSGIKKSDAPGPQWLSETLHEREDGIRFSFRADRILFEDKTEHQHLVVFETPRFGTVMMLDGVTQITTRDEFIYHEMLAHVPILAHGAARQVLIVGGGDGGMAEEVLKHAGVERLTQVEIDAGVVEFSKRYFADVNKGVFDEQRFDLVIADGMEFVATTDRRFDVIIVDSTDPVGPGAVLFTKEFYTACKRCLTDGGVLVTQNGVPFMQDEELHQSVSFFSQLFADAWCYTATIPTYIGGPMALGWASDNADLRDIPLDTLSERFAAAGIDTRYYTPEVHKAAFALPRYILDTVEHAIR